MIIPLLEALALGLGVVSSTISAKYLIAGIMARKMLTKELKQFNLNYEIKDSEEYVDEHYEEIIKIVLEITQKMEKGQQKQLLEALKQPSDKGKKQFLKKVFKDLKNEPAPL